VRLTLALVLLSGALAMPRIVRADQPPATPAPASGAQTAQGKGKPAPPVLTEDPEVKLGRENAEENDKQVKLVTDAAIVERVNRIGQEIAAVANTVHIKPQWGIDQLKPFTFTFKVVDDKDVNAYSLPGGFIYVNKGLLDYVHSDDELAGVLAHETGHVIHHHVLKLISLRNKIDLAALPVQIAALVAAIASRGRGAYDAQNVMLAAQLYETAKINTYGIEAEKDADRTGLLLLTHTHYNPVGLYSFMLRLTVLEQKTGPTELGIFRTHPPGEERSAAAKALLDELHIPIRLSDVDPQLKAKITLTKSGPNGLELAEIKMRDIVICRVAAADGLTAEQRAERVAAHLNSLVDARLQPFEIRPSGDQSRVLARGVTVLTQADADAQQKTVEALAHEMSDAMAQYLLKQQLESGI
jgi:predicted Zn-dependent protease